MTAYAVCAAAGLALAAAFPSPGLWPLAWLALVPLLVSVRGKPLALAFRLGWTFGLSFYLAALYWVAPTVSNYTRIPVAVSLLLLLLLAVVVALGPGLFALGLEWMAAARISRVLVAPILWVVIEWSRTFFPVGFPWVSLGYSQHSVLTVLQTADLAGVYGISALLVFVNTALAELRDGAERHRRLVAAVVVLLVAVVTYGHLRLLAVEGARAVASIRVGLVQANVEQAGKWDDRLQDDILGRHMALSRQAVERGAELIVWPEASLPFVFNSDPRSRELLDFAATRGVHMLVGAPGYGPRNGKAAMAYNEALHISAAGTVAEPYEKIQLVPFGEYVPFGPLLGWVDRAVEVVGTFGRGSRRVVFEGPRAEFSTGPRPARFSALICYEAIFPSLVRSFVTAGADLLVNISNDAWYGRSSAPHQHLAMSAMRAIEHRMPLVRATNTGISAFVAPSGRVISATGLFETAVVVETVMIPETGSVYSTVGDLFVYLCLAALVLLAYTRHRLGIVLIDGRGRGILGGP
ncbi:apolipoprotein N-acyltransferase [Pseudomonas sp.]|uniref:apolipoprotein N-acyltransferase n=1 Tax=Pseudomonas sp. TaxID=306 RepID=UPI00398220F7